MATANKVTKSNHLPGLGGEDHFKVFSKQFNDLVDVVNGVSSNVFDIDAAVTAYAGGGQANATILSKYINVVTVAASTGDSVVLPVGVTGTKINVFNFTANPIDLFPAVGEAIEVLPANTQMAIPPLGDMELVYTGTLWGVLNGSNVNRVSDNVTERTVDIDISKVNIEGMNGTAVEVVPAVAGASIEFISGVLIYDYDTAAYTGGGDVTLEYSGGAAVSTTIAAADSFGAAGDKVFSFAALNAAGGYTMPVNTALDITNATAAFADPGTAAGVGRLHVKYRVHTTEL